ncbi:hypothetical protein ACIQUL_29640 [Streptomyces sp. NPDC090303]|uniref:hypothetical protein n=1 Tax=Streptomyces sp. NPDC090303 TaxID=3365960 RepID=UPI0038086614
MNAVDETLAALRESLTSQVWALAALLAAGAGAVTASLLWQRSGAGVRDGSGERGTTAAGPPAPGREKGPDVR